MSVSSSFTLVRNGNFRIFLTGQTLSWLGSVMQSVAQGWLVWSLTKSAAHLALTAVMVSLPVLLFSMLGGMAADRFDKRALLVITQGASLVPALLLGVLTCRGEITPPGILVLAFLQGTVNAFEIPTRQAFLSELVSRDQLSHAVSLNAVSFNAMRLFGPAAAGCTIAAFGAAPCFFINAVSFLVGILALLLVRLPKGRLDQLTRPQAMPLSELREGLRFVMCAGEIRQQLLSVALVSLLGIPFVPLLPVFADSFQVGPLGLGVMSACVGSGSLLAALALALSGDLSRRKGGPAAAGMLFALALLLFSRSWDYRLALVSLFIAGGAVVLFLALVNRTLQQACPAHLRGRVMGAYTLALMGMAPLGSAVVGWLAANLGAAGALSVSSSVCLVGMLLLQEVNRVAVPEQRLGHFSESWLPASGESGARV